MEIDLNQAEQVLDEQHYGLKKVKERIVEQIAVMALNKKAVWFYSAFCRCTGYRQDQYLPEHCSKHWNREYVRISLRRCP